MPIRAMFFDKTIWLKDAFVVRMESGFLTELQLSAISHHSGTRAERIRNPLNIWKS